MFGHTPLYLVAIGTVITIVHCVLTHLLRVHEIRIILRISRTISKDPVQKQLQVELVETLIQRIGRHSAPTSRVAFASNLLRSSKNKHDADA